MQIFFQYAIEFDQPEIIKELNFLGGSSNIHVLSLNLNQESREGKSILIEGIERIETDNEALLEILLSSVQNVKLNEQDGLGSTPLHVAVEYNQYKTIRLLLLGGANQKILNNKGESLVVLAKMGGYKTIKKLLKKSK